MDAFEALKDHYLAGIDCNEENHTDTAACSCALMMATPQPSIGRAVQQWINHLRDVVEGRWTQQGALDAIRAARPTPQPARMPCPYCGIDHLDVGEWETRPHHKHLCLHCGKLFRFEGADGEYFYGVADPDHHP